jgi:hypothetical protein
MGSSGSWAGRLWAFRVENGNEEDIEMNNYQNKLRPIPYPLYGSSSSSILGSSPNLLFFL